MLHLLSTAILTKISYVITSWKRIYIAHLAEARKTKKNMKHARVLKKREENLGTTSIHKCIHPSMKWKSSKYVAEKLILTRLVSELMHSNQN